MISFKWKNSALKLLSLMGLIFAQCAAAHSNCDSEQGSFARLLCRIQEPYEENLAIRQEKVTHVCKVWSATGDVQCESVSLTRADSTVLMQYSDPSRVFRTSEIVKFLDTLSDILGLPPHDMIVACGNSFVTSAEVGPAGSAGSKEAALAACARAIEAAENGGIDAGPLGDGGNRHAIDAAIRRIDGTITQCVSSTDVGGTVAFGPALSAAFELFIGGLAPNVLVAAAVELIHAINGSGSEESSDPKPSVSSGSEDGIIYSSGNTSTQEKTKWVSSVSYVDTAGGRYKVERNITATTVIVTKYNEDMTVASVKATTTTTTTVTVTDPGSLTTTYESSVVVVTENGRVISQTIPEMTVTNPDGTTETLPAGSPIPMPFDGGNCLDIDCSSTCEERQAWWNDFKANCESRNWETYECKTIGGACADPASVMPLPDGDFHCSVPATKAEIREARLAFCRVRSGVMSTTEPGGDSCTINVTKDESKLSARSICNDPRARLLPEDMCALTIPIPKFEKPPEVQLPGGNPPRPMSEDRESSDRLSRQMN